jgi:hypothetical protein
MKENHMNIAKFLRAAIAMTALCFGVAQTAQADVRFFSGDTTTAPTADLSDLTYGDATHYAAYTLNLAWDGDYTFYVATTGFDSVLLIYEGAFSPTNPTNNFLYTDDDLFDGFPGASGFAGTLESGTYTLVVAGWDNDAYGQYGFLVTGPGPITAVPEPATWLMLAAGIAAVSVARRRKA